MKAESLKKAPVHELSALYEEAAIRHGAASLNGEHRVANAQYKRLLAAWMELRSRGEEGRAALLRLMNEGTPPVQVWAASHVLEFGPAAAEAKLEQLAKGAPGLARHDAEMTLKEWRAGNLTFPAD